MDGRISAKEYATLRKVSPAAVTKWLEAGKLGPLGDAYVKNGRRYLIDSLKADRYLEINGKLTNQRLDFGSGPVVGDPGDGIPANGTEPVKKLDSYREATTWKIRYEALQKQHDYEISIGKYVLADDVKAAAFNKARTIRDMLLNIPSKLSPVLAAESDNEQVYALLNDEIRLVLEELAS